MKRKLINPPQLYKGAGSGMSQTAIESRSGLVFISGQVDWNQQYKTTERFIEEQMQKALENLSIALKNAGSSVDKLLQIRIYVRGEFYECMEEIAPILYDFLGESRPAITGVGVASLASPETLVEVEAIAYR